MVEDIRGENNNTRLYILDLFVGNLIGSGAYRRVYTLLKDHKMVLKVEHSGISFCNVHEWQVWNSVKDTPLAVWFAPCHDIDAMGMALIQSRTTPLLNHDHFQEEIAKLPKKKLPSFLDDVHFGNFGMMDGRLVCHDYGFTHFLKNGVETHWRKEQKASEDKAKRKKKATAK